MACYFILLHFGGIIDPTAVTLGYSVNRDSRILLVRATVTKQKLKVSTIYDSVRCRVPVREDAYLGPSAW